MTSVPAVEPAKEAGLAEPALVTVTVQLDGDAMPPPSVVEVTFTSTGSTRKP